MLRIPHNCRHTIASSFTNGHSKLTWNVAKNANVHKLLGSTQKVTCRIHGMSNCWFCFATSPAAPQHHLPTSKLCYTLTRNSTQIKPMIIFQCDNLAMWHGTARPPYLYTAFSSLPKSELFIRKPTMKRKNKSFLSCAIHSFQNDAITGKLC